MSAAEGAVSDSETLAMFLACGSEMPANRLELVEQWEEKKESVRVAYRLRAMRLIRTWGR